MPRASIRILLVEDFRPYRSFVALLLSKNFQANVYEAEDGLEAVVQAQRLKPDVVLIDVGLPKLNGLEVARQIRELVPNSKILFLSALEDPDVVRAAIRTGAIGYVVKSDAGSELTKAVENVLRGQRFISSKLRGLISEGAEDSPTPNGPIRKQNFASSSAPDPARETKVHRCHEVQFYSNDALLLGRLTYFIGEALMAGNGAIVFATKRHRDDLFDELKFLGVDVDSLMQWGTFISLDAAETLSSFMVNDQPDATRFFEAFGNLVQSALNAATAKHPRIAIFGEAVALLWAAENRKAALRLEQLGNELVKTHPVDILCAYPFSLNIQEDLAAFNAVCAEHSAFNLG